jgi:iron(II)-dependent oxidoreductase
MQGTKKAVFLGVMGLISAVALCVGWLAAIPVLAAGGGTGLGYVLLRCASGNPRLLTFRRRRKTPSPPPAEPKPEIQRPPEFSDPSDLDTLVERMLIQGRYALLLRPQVAGNLSDEQFARAREALDAGMGLVPDGEVVLGRIDRALEERQLDEEEVVACQGRVIRVERFFLDRHTVTNRQFYEFVADGGYQQISLWDQKIWPAVLDFVDQTGEPGPAFWKDGCYEAGREDHPVVGVSWYEAAAYARWVGKRLPSDAEWVKAGSWPVTLSATTRVQRKYPWGDTMDRARANLWGSGPEGTAPVDQFPEGVSVGGVYQLIGNVWEWTRGDLTPDHALHQDLMLEIPMKSIRGGAFDTYFDKQATCQFQSGEAAMARKRNIGFRCAVGVCDLTLARTAKETAEPAELESELAEEVQV